MANTAIRKAKKRSFTQKMITDPFSALILFLFLGIFKLLPLDAASFLGGKMGLLLGRLFKKKNEVMLHNLKKVFPNKPLKERKMIAKEVWMNWGRMIAEIPHLDKIVSSRLSIEGEEFLIKAGKKGTKGGFFFSAHLSNFEIAAHLSKRFHISMSEVYRSANNPWIEGILFKKRCEKLIPKGAVGARKMIDALQNKEWIALLCDQKMNDGVEVSFLGQKSMATPNVAKIALKRNIPVHPVHIKRIGHRAFFKVVIEPSMTPENPQRVPREVFKMTQEMNDRMTEWVYESPSEWLWIHRRWDKKEYRKN
ncbi:MAG: hypothetical protein EOM53_03375 [Alphaproteobacteria bacterium]|nr:hypothetical protein [Alphaproteobacteria bacterium]